MLAASAAFAGACARRTAAFAGPAVARVTTRSARTFSTGAANSPQPAQGSLKLKAQQPTGWAYFRKHYLSDSATYPIIGIISGAVCLLTFALARQAVGNPDVKWDKAHRLSTIDENDEEGYEHYEHPIRRYASKKGTSRVAYPLVGKSDD